MCPARRVAVSAWLDILAYRNFFGAQLGRPVGAPACGLRPELGPARGADRTDKWRAAVTAALRETPLSASLVDGYTARHLTVLEGLEAVSRRPGIYIGSTDGRGMLHCLWEIIDNAVDEALNATCTKIEVILHADHSAEVRDDGRGIPVHIEPKTGLNS